MGTPVMFASAPTPDGQWYAMRVRANGSISGVIPGLFESKTASDANAKRDLGSKE